MSGDKKTIDEIWKELNAKKPGRSGTLGTVLGGSSNMPGVTSTSRTLPRTVLSNTEPVIRPDVAAAVHGVAMHGASLGPSAAVPVSVATSADTAKPAVPGRPAEPHEVQRVPMPDDIAVATAARRHASHYDATKAGVSPEELSAYVATIQRTINCLSDPDRNTRKQAATALLAKAMHGDSVSPKPSPQLLQALLCGTLLYPVCTLLHDPGEATRIAAGELLVHGAETVPDFGGALPVVMPEVVKRMGTLPVAEPAEEVRLLLIKLVAVVVRTSSASTLATYCGDAVAVTLRALEDAYHEAKKAGCGCCVALAARVPRASVEAAAEKLLAALLPNLSHQHSRVRLCVIEALEALVLCGGVPAGLVESTAAPALRPVAYDRAPAVRTALSAALAKWLGAPVCGTGGSSLGPASGEDGGAGVSKHVAAQPSRELAAVLLPLLLVGLSDPVPEVSSETLVLVEAVGDAWLARGGGRSDDGLQASSSASAASPPPAATSMEGVETAGGGDAADVAAAVAACGLTHPFAGRPATGARALAVDLLPLVLPPVLSDLGEWTVALRACAVRQLHSLLILAEAGATPQLSRLLPSLCIAIGDEATEIADRVIACVHVLGAHTLARHWLPLMLDQVSNSKASLAQKANTLVVLSGLLHATAKLSGGGGAVDVPPEGLRSLCEALCSDDMRASEHAAIQQQLLAAASNMVRWLGPGTRAVVQQLYTLLLQLYGFERDDGHRTAIAEVMARLAAASGAGGFESLADMYGPDVLAGAVSDTAGWSAEAPSYLVFRALLLTAGPGTLSRLVPQLCDALAPILADPEADVQLRLGALQLLDALMEDAARRDSLGGPAAGLVAARLLLPPLVWRAGKSAAAVRFAAATALATMLRNKLAPPELLAAMVESGKLLPLVHQSMDEDWYVDLRNTACFVEQQLLLAVGPGLSDASRRAIYPELLKRLDDSSNAVRMAACRALVAFCDTMPETYCDTNSGYLAAGVVIHMDDANIEVQEAACGVMQALAVVKPRVVAAEVGKVHDRFRSKHYCARVLATCDKARQAAM